ncbi:hypothetical protein QQS21_004545 [Conoideocrella luteorostrata]|uniref:Uncharacterized protein n=1 Tax=Conoideocrella luteorostrata TaxID=1105319 RepID=A0AAJ0FVB9_9HYPO|nr:hypothetical protein QQS21_004545 [Conoideocrella luteorostrata]
MLESCFESNNVSKSITNTLKEKGGEIKHIYKADIFTGLSVEFSQEKVKVDLEAFLEHLKGIKCKWPVHQRKGNGQKQKPQGNDSLMPDAQKPGTLERKRSLGGRALDKCWTHIMTQVALVLQSKIMPAISDK